MSPLDTAPFLKEIAPGAPSGPNLEYDSAFVELGRAAQGKQAGMVESADEPPSEPDWRDVRRRAIELLGRAKDLRVLVHLARAAIVVDGLVGFADCLRLVRRWLESFWDSVHPQLDPDDDNDPTMRNNAVVALGGNDSILPRLREAPLVASRALGVFSLRDVLVASGMLPASPGAAVPAKSTIDAAFKDSDLEGLKATGNALTQAVEDVIATEALILDKVGSERAIDLTPLADLLKQARTVVDKHLAARGVGSVAAAGAAGIAGAGVAGAVAGTTHSIGGGGLGSRDDAVRLIEQLCDFFERSEPSSPVPVLLRRAQRLIGKSYMDILKDLTPDAVAQAEVLRGGAVDTVVSAEQQ